VPLFGIQNILCRMYLQVACISEICNPTDSKRNAHWEPHSNLLT
jgi:hypothetical protein